MVDDERAVNRAIRRLLRRHRVATESDPREALARVRRGERFDVVLCDLMMPGMTGIQVYGELARLDPELASRVVVITGGALGAEQRTFIQAGKLRVVFKPFDGDELTAVLDDLGPRGDA